MRGKSQRLIKYAVGAVVVAVLAFFLYKSTMKESFDSNSPKSTLEIENAGAFNDLLSSSKKTVAYFYMPSCGHCKTMSPIFDDVSSDPSNSGVKFVKINVTKNPDLSDKYGLTGFPTVLRFNGAKTSEKDKSMGASDKASLQKFCNF